MIGNKWSDLIPRPKSRFLRIKCMDCGNEQIVFSNVSSVVHCNVCGGILAEPSGGRAKIRGEIVSLLE